MSDRDDLRPKSARTNSSSKSLDPNGVSGSRDRVDKEDGEGDEVTHVARSNLFHHPG
jgi:hypothetical protein